MMDTEAGLPIMGTFAGAPAEAGAEQMASEGGRDRLDRPISVTLFVVVVALFSGRVAAEYRPLTYLIGDCPYYAATAVSLIEDHDLDLRNQLSGGLAIHGRQIALGRDGAWYPKHPLLMPIAAIPFVLLFGVPGTLVFNLVVLSLLAVVLMRLARTVAPPWAAALAAFLLIAGTFLRRYDYNFSPDLFATLVLSAALLALLHGRDRLGGLLLGLSVTAKLTDLFLVPLGPIYAHSCRGWRAAVRASLAAAVPLAAYGLSNFALFGSPWVTSYDRNVAVADGAFVTVGHRGLFDQGVLSGLAGELFDPVHGLLPTSPILLLAIPGFVLLLRRRPREAVLFLAIGEFLLLFFATYRYWSASHYGNRFLMPLVAVTAPSIALSLQWIVVWLRSRLMRGQEAAILNVSP